MISHNKASSLNHINAEPLKNGTLRTAPLLSLYFTGFMMHGLLSDSMLSVMFVPVKDKARKISSLDIYRAIALASTLSQVLEKNMLDRISEFIHSTIRLFLKSKN